MTAVLTVCGMSRGAGVVLLAALRFGAVGISMFKEHRVASEVMPVVSQTWPACYCPLRCQKNVYLGAELTQQTCIHLRLCLFCERCTQTCQTTVDLICSAQGDKKQSAWVRLWEGSGCSVDFSPAQGS